MSSLSKLAIQSRIARTVTSVLAGVAIGIVAVPSIVQAADSAATSGFVARWVGKAQKVGTADANKKTTISIYLKLQNLDALKALVKAQSTPGSAEYGHYLKPADFRARFAPAAADVLQAEKTLKNLGFSIVHEPSSKFYIEVAGTVGQIKSAFHISQDLYAYGGKTLRANAEEPTLPAGLAGIVTYIGGLDETGLLKHPFHSTIGDNAAASAKVSPSAAPPTAAGLPSPYCSTYFGDTTAKTTKTLTPYGNEIPWLICGYTPQQMRAAYGFDKVTLTGAGITVAIVDAYASPTIVYDANHYAKNHGLPPLTPANFSQDVPLGIYGVKASETCGPQGWYTEESLDVAAVHSTAPGANIVYVGSRDCGTSLDDALYDAIDNSVADIMTSSWGFTGDPLSPYERLVFDSEYLQAAAQGITLTFSSGDNADVAPETGIAQASYPAASPLVTAVGGTSLALTDPYGTKTEFGWGTFRAYLKNATVKSSSKVATTGLEAYSFYSGAGGGPSLYEPEPYYQASVVPGYFADGTYDIDGNFVPFSNPARVVPDVAMLADPYTGFLYGETYTIAGNPFSDAGCTPRSATLEYCENGIGGTSLASPLFAGTIAVLDQLRVANGLPKLGFANPVLYSLTPGAPGSTTSALVDVQQPTAPTSILRGYANDLHRIRLVTINSVGFDGCPGGICQGIDGFSLVTQPGYDNSTGLGVPYVPALLTTLGAASLD